MCLWVEAEAFSRSSGKMDLSLFYWFDHDVAFGFLHLEFSLFSFPASMSDYNYEESTSECCKAT